MPYDVPADLEKDCINAIRLLAAETVEKAKSGHPGAPMGLAPLAFVLFTQHMKLDPSNSLWVIHLKFFDIYSSYFVVC